MEKNAVTPSEIVELASHRIWPAISLYLPTARAGPEVMQGHIRLKNALVTAEQRLVSHGMRGTLARDLLAPAAELVANTDFWNNRLDGVAVFIAEGEFRAYHLPFPVPEALSVSDVFYLRPLIPALHQVPLFYALVLDKKHVRLIRCRVSKATEVKVPNLPESYEAFHALDYSEKQLQSHSVGHGGMITHGAGDKGAEEKGRLQRFCVAIDHAVCEHLNPEHPPIVLFATQEEIDTYVRVSDYPNLLEPSVVGSPKMLELPEEVRAAASGLLSQKADEKKTRVLSEYRRMAGTGFTSQQVEDIVLAAAGGRVDSLVIDPGSKAWGSADTSLARVEVHQAPVEDDVDLINMAMLETLNTSGKVYEATHMETGSESPMVAVYRY